MALGMLGKYERLDVLGHGVSGIVYLAKDTLLNKQVALKEVDVQAGDLRRFLEEARVMDRLRHPNIVRVNGVDRIDGKIVIDMEYVRGKNLQDTLRTEGVLPLDRALDIIAQVLDALDYAHRMQTVHRDIKPANILVGRDGEIKLVDFGLAEILATNAYAGGAGTYAYMAPEDFAEDDRSDSQSDIWAVGVTLYEMVAGQRPFQVARVKDPFSWKRVLETQLPTPITDYLPDAPPGLRAILDRALERNKSRRYRTAGEFRDDVVRLREGQSLASSTLRLQKEITARRLSEYDLTHHNGHKPHVPEYDLTDSMKRAAEAGYAVTDTGPAPPPDLVTQPLPAPRRPFPEWARPEHVDPTPLATKWEGPGTVVAEVTPTDAAVPGKRSRLGLFQRKDASLLVDPQSVDFGTVYKGETRTAKVHARVLGVESAAEGRVLSTPGWLTIHPTAFDRHRQTITLTAHSARTWETGEFNETVRVESSAGVVEIPVRLIVLRSRPTFRHVAKWYVPGFLTTLLPVLAVAFGNSGASSAQATQTMTRLIPSASLSTGLLATMLLLVGVAANVGIAERLACGLLMAVMCFVLGVSAQAGAHSTLAREAMTLALPMGMLVAVPLLLQLFTLRRWKFWVAALIGLGLVTAGVFLHVLNG
ncbi:MAG: Serine/threonine protein kinase [Chthonomonadaceae bacterium]|nr:Serine/threonine protein kinase [Chthonomonadaceae bacterium]